MESEKFSTSGLYWLCKEAENRSFAVDSPEIPPVKIPDSCVPVAEASPAPEKRRRGRPLKGEAAKKRKKEDEDVCFICFDGGSLVLCDRGDCPKAYHPACIKRDEAFFQSSAKWTCGWHICSKCQKSVSRYMCYTCTYSLCKGCIKDADYLCVRGNKGFCSTCYRVVVMIENISQENKETVQVDFDDNLSWEYLFKVYWICLKKDLSLTVDEITCPRKPWTEPSKVTRRGKASAVYNLSSNGTMMTRENPTLSNHAISNTSVRSVCDINNASAVITTWASKELLDFVADMRNGDTSVLSQKEVQALLFDHVKRNNLRDPHQRSEIICDSKLENLFGKPRVRHFEMLSLLEFHFLKKDESQRDEVEGDIVAPVVRQVTGESNSDNLPIISENSRHKVDRKDEERVDINMGNGEKDACEKLERHIDLSGSINNGPSDQACLISKSLSGVKSEIPVASLSTGRMPSANDKEAEISWHYRDLSGKVQGPFRIEQLHKWSSTATFPPDMRIWRLNTDESDTVLLVDVIKGQIPIQNNLSLSPQEVKGTSDGKSHHCDGPWSANTNPAGMDIDTDVHLKSKLEFDKAKEAGNLWYYRDPSGKVQGPFGIEQLHKWSSTGTFPPDMRIWRLNTDEHYSVLLVDVIEGQITLQNNLSPSPQKVEGTSDGTSHHSDEPSTNRVTSARGNGPVPHPSNWITPVTSIDHQLKNDTKIENSSKPLDPDPPEVISASNHPRVQRLSTFAEKTQETSADENRSNVGQAQSSIPNYDNLSSQGSMVSQATCRQCHDNQMNEQYYLGQPCSDEPLCQSSSVNYWSSHKSHPQYTPMADRTDASKQKFCINLQDIPMPIPKSSTEELQAQTIKPMAIRTDASEQNFSINLLDIPMPMPKTSTGELQAQTIKPMANRTDASEQKFSIDLQDITTQRPIPKTSTGELQAQTIKPKRKSSKTRRQEVKSKDKGAENSWHYRDPSGKVQGPFGIEQFHKWSSSEKFPPDMRIWKLNTSERDSVLLVDVIKGQMPLQNNLSLTPQEVKVTSTSASSHCDSPFRSRVKSAGTDTDAYSKSKHDFAKGNKPVPHSSNWKTTVISNDPHINNGANIKDSSKRRDPEPDTSEVISSYSNQPRVHSAERSPTFTVKPIETSVDENKSNVAQTRSSAPNYEYLSSQGNTASQTTGRQCHDDQINEQHYLGRPSSDGPLCQNSSLNIWNSNKSHAQYAFMANPTDASVQKFSINFQDFPMSMQKTSTEELQAHTVKEQQWEPPQVSDQNLSLQNVLSLTTKSIDHDEKDYPRNQKTASLTNNYEKIQVTEKPSMEEWDSCFLSVSSLKPQEMANNHVATSTSKSDKFPPPSPPNPVPNASSWLAMVTEPIEFDTLAEESVSDLLAEVDAMESNSDLASPNQLMDYADDLFHDSKTDCFSSLRGLSFPLDRVKNDALNSSRYINIMLPPQSTMREEPILAHSNNVLDPLKKPRKHLSTSSVLEVETKQFDIQADQFEFRSNRNNSSPKKKTRELADILNGPTKHGSSKSPGSTRKESDQGTPRGKHRSSSSGFTTRESHQKHAGDRLPSPRERNDRNHPGGDSGFSKGRPSWSRQSSFGSGGVSGGHSRPLPRGQRVCKFYESGYCRKGTFCDYFHP